MAVRTKLKGAGTEMAKYTKRANANGTYVYDPNTHECVREESWAEHDAQGIYLCRVCDVCRDAKLSQYRPEILTGYSQEDVDEPIEPEDGGW